MYLAWLLAAELVITPIVSLLAGSNALEPWSYRLVASSFQVISAKRTKGQPSLPLPIEEIEFDERGSEDGPAQASFVENIGTPMVHAMLALLFLFDQTTFLSCFAALPLLATVCRRVTMEKELVWERESSPSGLAHKLVNLYNHNSDLLKLSVLLALAIVHILNKCPITRSFDLSPASSTLTHFVTGFLLPELFQFFGWGCVNAEQHTLVPRQLHPPSKS